MSPDLVDEEKLPSEIARLLGISDSEAMQPDVVSRIADIELTIDEARATGRLTRYTRQLEKSGTVVGHVYKRADLMRLLRSLPASQVSVAPTQAA